MDKAQNRRRPDKREKNLRIAYAVFWVVFLSVIIYTPHFIKDSISMGNNFLLREELVESFLLGLLIFIGCVIKTIYKFELRRREQKIEELEQVKIDAYQRLNSASRYIGEVNVQVQSIQSAFSALQKYPRDKKEFKQILYFLAEKTLSMVNVPWVMFRVINTANFKTLREHIQVRSGVTIAVSNDKFSNRAISSKKAINGDTVIGTDQDILTIKAFCILPIKKMTVNQQRLIKGIVNELEIIFIFFTSQYCREIYFKKNIDSDILPAKN